LRDDVKALRAERDALGDSVIDDVQRRWIEWRLERKERALQQWQAKLAWLQLDTGGQPKPADASTTPDTTETDTAAARDRAKRLVTIEQDLQRQLFETTHTGADRIKAEHERLVGELGDLATADTSDKVGELIARAGAVRDARLAQLAATETEAAERRRAAGDRIIEGLEAERRALVLTDRQRFIGEAQRRLSAEATDEERRRVRELAGALYDEKQAHEAVRAAAEERDRQLEAGRRIRESLRSAEEAYGVEITELNTLLRQGAIDQETYARAGEEAYERMLAASRDWSAGVVRALRDYGREAGDASRKFEEVTTSALKASEDAWVEWAQTGKLTVTDFFSTLEEAALRAAYQMMVMKPLSGFLGGLLGNLDFDLFGGGGGGGAIYAPSAPHNSAFGLLGHAHAGGMIGGPNAFTLAPAPPRVVRRRAALSRRRCGGRRRGSDCRQAGRGGRVARAAAPRLRLGRRGPDHRPEVLGHEPGGDPRARPWRARGHSRADPRGGGPRHRPGLVGPVPR
jgi:lambda family phage tail tape measure protein